jgi:hypothetical protein
MAVMVKTLGYYSHKGGAAAKGLSKLKSHLKYLEYGKVHENEPKGFTRESDTYSRSEFYGKVEAQPERGVIAHKLVFSLSQDERDRLGVDLKQMVRDTMAGWEATLGRPLNWIGFQHEDKGHPHVHVVVGGYAGDKQVGIYQRDLDWLRKTADRSKESLAKEPTRELTPQQEAQRLHRQMEEHARVNTRFFERILGQDRGLDRGR